MPGHWGIKGNEIADQFARMRSQCPLKGPELAYIISAGVTKTAIRDQMNRDHRNTGNP
jgi:hypothetical protein